YVLSAIYELPLKAPGAWQKLAGGWNLAGIFNWQTGNPFTPLVPTMRSGSLELFDRPDVVPGQSVSLSNPTPNLWFNRDAFVLNPLGRFGHAGRHIITAPPFKNLDLALLKNTNIHERFHVQFRAEFFDLTNHANFAQPSRFVLIDPVTGRATGTFGVVSSTRSPRGDLGSSRQIEFGLKILF